MCNTPSKLTTESVWRPLNLASAWHWTQAQLAPTYPFFRPGAFVEIPLQDLRAKFQDLVAQLELAGPKHFGVRFGDPAPRDFQEFRSDPGLDLGG